MSAEKSTNQLLIVDGDQALGQTVREQFAAAGYEVHLAATAGEGLALALSLRPNLILLAARLPDMAGLDVIRALHDKPRTAHIPVMILAGHNDLLDQTKFLEAGAYDFIEKPLDLDILLLRVRNALRRAEREGLTEPRTGLPTGRLLQERVRNLERERGWTRLDLKIDGFGHFRDRYGFVTANEALRFAGRLIEQIVGEYGSPDDFVGHVANTEEFVIITTQARGSRLRDVLARRVTDELASFYNFIERDQGYVLVEDGSGKPARKPLMSAQIQMTVGDPDPHAPPDDVWVDAADEIPPGEPSGSPFEW